MEDLVIRNLTKRPCVECARDVRPTVGIWLAEQVCSEECLRKWCADRELEGLVVDPEKGTADSLLEPSPISRYPKTKIPRRRTVCIGNPL